MAKSLYLIFTAGITVTSLVVCEDPQKRLSIRELAVLKEISPELMLKFTDLTAYRNIVNAAGEASKSSRVEKSVKQFVSSLHNLVDVCTQETTNRLNPEEKAILGDMYNELREIFSFITSEIDKIKDITDLVTREQKEAELREKILERTTQFYIKSVPFATVLKEQKFDPAEIDKTLHVGFDQFIPEVNRTITARLKK
jgi:hypothetical protein